MIADISASTQNIRHGIEILHRAGRIADRTDVSEIDPEMVRMARVSVYPEMRPEVLHDLIQHELYILLAVTRILLAKSFTATTVSDAYEDYKLVCEEYDEKIADKSKFNEYIESLETLGIISLLDSKRSTTGDKKRITIHDVPAAILKERTETRLSEYDEQ